MSAKDNHPKKYSEFRSIYKYYIDSYNALYQLKTEKEEELNSIYKMIKTNLIDSKEYPPEKIMNGILHTIPFNNRYAKSYLKLAKLISDDYHVTEIHDIDKMLRYLFYKEYGINLDKSDDFNNEKYEILDIFEENTICNAIMKNDLKKFISFTESEHFNKDQQINSQLYAYSYVASSLLEICCYYGAVDCFKLMRSKFCSEITKGCLILSFLGGNPDIMSECLKHQQPDKDCMEYAIISHNIDFVSFLMNEYNIEINLNYCGTFNNLDAFLVYLDQTNNVNECFVESPAFDTPSLCEYFLYIGVDINAQNRELATALHYAALDNKKEIAELLLSHGANINSKDLNGETPLHYATSSDYNETYELFLSHGANIDEKDTQGQTSLYKAAFYGKKEVVELLLSHGANINEKNKFGQTVLHGGVFSDNKETIEFILSQDVNVNEKDNCGQTALHLAALNNKIEMAEILISRGANINEKDEVGHTALDDALLTNSTEIAEFLKNRV